jgi:hypothetical protein
VSWAASETQQAAIQADKQMDRKRKGPTAQKGRGIFFLELEYWNLMKVRFLNFAKYSCILMM